MPINYFACDKCKAVSRKLVPVKADTEQPAKDPPCQTEGCDGHLKRIRKPPSFKVIESLDNGLMVRKVERVVNVEELMAERSRNKNESS